MLFVIITHIDKMVIIGKKKADFTIIFRDNETNKCKSFVFSGEIKTNKELMDLVQELLIKYFEKKKV